MDYRVLIVDDERLPLETDWVIARANGVAYFIIKRRRFSVEGGLCDLLSEAWEMSADSRGAPLHAVAV